MNAQDHIDKAERLLADINASFPEGSTMKIKAANTHIKLAKWKYRHGETLY